MGFFVVFCCFFFNKHQWTYLPSSLLRNWDKSQYFQTCQCILGAQLKKLRTKTFKVLGIFLLQWTAPSHLDSAHSGQYLRISSWLTERGYPENRDHMDTNCEDGQLFGSPSFLPATLAKEKIKPNFVDLWPWFFLSVFLCKDHYTASKPFTKQPPSQVCRVVVHRCLPWMANIKSRIWPGILLHEHKTQMNCNSWEIFILMFS